MKPLIIFLAITLSSSLFAQLSGEVTYQTKINMHKKLPDNEQGEMMRSFIPEFTEFDNKLLFSGTETLYSNVEAEEDETVSLEEEGHGHRFMIKRMAPVSDIIYANTESMQIVEKKEFMDKVFLIKDSLNNANWKLTGEMKEVSGMNCMKAEYIPAEGDTSVIFAWFTPEIPVASGPAGYGGLPGLIVFLDKNDGQMQITLSNIVMRDVTADEIVEPTKGKVVTQEEFRTMRRKKMEQQKKQWEGHGKGGHHVIIKG